CQFGVVLVEHAPRVLTNELDIRPDCCGARHHLPPESVSIDARGACRRIFATTGDHSNPRSAYSWDKATPEPTGDGRWQVTVGEPTSKVSKTHGTPQSLRGRGEELARLYRMVDDLSHHGGAIVVRGEAGIGKSALLAATSRHAHDRGAMVLSASGVESEAQFPFAGLHQLLRPSLSLLPRLPEPQRHALEMAFGLGSHRGVSDVFLIGLATLGLVSELATEAPVLLVVDDAHWLDRSSAKALAFVARRLEMEPAVLLLAVRDEVSSDIDEAGLAELRGGRLDSDASRALLDVTGAVLSEDLKDRILEAAAGNPLALTELPIAAS